MRAKNRRKSNIQVLNQAIENLANRAQDIDLSSGSPEDAKQTNDQIKTKVEPKKRVVGLGIKPQKKVPLIDTRMLLTRR